MPPESRERRLLEGVLARLKGLGATVTDLLDFARPRHTQIQPVEIAPLLEACGRDLRADPQYQGVEVRVEGDAPTLSADPKLLQVAVGQLLENAAQAMDGQGTIRVTTQ